MGSAHRQAHELEDAMNFPVEKLSSMTLEQERQFWEQFERDLDSDTGSAETSVATRELYEVALARLPKELFIAYSESRWDQWVEFFSRTREPDGRRKGIVEVQLRQTVLTVQALCRRHMSS
jgi:hypothetical protein